MCLAQTNLIHQCQEQRRLCTNRSNGCGGITTSRVSHQVLLWSSIDTMAKHALRFLVSSIEYCTAYSPIVRRANQSYLAPGRCLTICRSCMDHASNCGRRPSEGREANCHVRYAGAWERSRTVIVGLCIALVLLACMTVRMPGICPPRQSRAIGL